jgi:hypothetical protein
MPFWLPVPDGQNYELLLRMYFPNSTDPSILNGTYTIPAVQIVPEPATLALLCMVCAFAVMHRLALRKRGGLQTGLGAHEWSLEGLL